MASDRNFLEFILDLIDNVGNITYKILFGDYGIYSNHKLFALICDNQLYIEPTDAEREFIKDIVEARSYPGAKLSFLIEYKIDDREWISNLVRITVKEVPEAKVKKMKHNERK